MNKLLSTLRNVFSRQKAERDLDAEVRSYSDLLQEENVSNGMDPNEARRAARMNIGGHEQLKQEIREARSGAFLETLWLDVRFGARMLRKNLGFTCAAVLTLALGIGANTAIFSAVYAVLLKPLPFKDPDSLVSIWKKNPPRGWVRNPISQAEFMAWRDSSRAFEQMAIYSGSSCVLTGGIDAEQDPCEVISSNLFPLIGVAPIRGRNFVSNEDNKGAAPSAILSYGLWQRRFGGDEAIIGRAITVNGVDYTVVGVMPEGFSHLYATPYNSIPQLWVSGIALSPTSKWNDYMAIGRLRPGATMQQAETEMNSVSERIDQALPDLKGWRAELKTLRTVDSGDTRVPLLVLMGAVSFVLLIACANVANLLLARGTARVSEFAVRRAIGASQSRLVRQLLTESLLISCAGGALGILLASWGSRGLLALAPSFLFKMAPGLAFASIDFRVLVFAVLASAATTVVFGLLPAIHASRSGATHSLKEAGRGNLQSRQSQIFRGALVISEIALAMVLLVGAGLMIRTLANVSHLNIGINPINALTMQHVSLTGERYKDPKTKVEFWSRVVSAVEALPGVESASVARGIPVGDWAGQFFTTDAHPNPPAGQNPDASYNVAGPNYFRVTGIPVRAGRAFDEYDTQTAERVVIVNEELARIHWPGQNPIGKRLRLGTATSTRPWLTVVGVAGNVLSRGPDEGFRPELYIPYQQFPWDLSPDTLLVRTAANINPASLSHAIVDEIHHVDKDQPAGVTETMEHAVERPIAQERWMMRMLGILAALALVLSTIGTYSVLAYAVAQRTREIGIRVALGAQPGSVLLLMIRNGARLAAVGISVGIAVALALTSLMNDFLFGVRASDPLTFVVVALILAASSFMACYVPARRATKVDPMVALRYE
jgi:predicted permease